MKDYISELIRKLQLKLSLGVAKLLTRKRRWWARLDSFRTLEVGWRVEEGVGRVEVGGDLN